MSLILPFSDFPTLHVPFCDVPAVLLEVVAAAAAAPSAPSPASTIVSLLLADALTSQKKLGSCGTAVIVTVALDNVSLMARRDCMFASDNGSSLANDDASFVAVGLPGIKSKSTTSLPVLLR